MLYLFIYFCVHVTEFNLQGYVIVENFFAKEELDACREAINVLVEELAQKLYRAGKIRS